MRPPGVAASNETPVCTNASCIIDTPGVNFDLILETAKRRLHFLDSFDH